MADSFFGFDNSLSNLNDDEGGGEPSEDEYDALNDETFGQDSEELDWEVEHEQLANQIESGRRQNVANIGIDSAANAQLEASLSQLVLDDLDPLRHSAFGSNVWRHDPPAFPTAPTPLPTLKNVCTVEELERQLHQKQMPQALAGQSYYQQQARYPPVILQRPPGLQAPVPLPFAPNQQMSHQPLNKMTPIGQNNPMMQNHMGPNSPMNQMGQNVNHIGQNLNQIGQNVNAMGQNMNQMTQSLNQFMQNSKPIGNQFQNNMMNIQNSHPMGQMNQISQNQLGQNNMGQNLNQIGQNLNQIGSNVNHMSQSTQSMPQNLNPIGQNMSQMGQNLNPIGQNINQMGQNVNHLGQNPNQMGQNVNQMGQNVNQMGQNVNQMGQNVNQMGQNVNHMGQNQMMSNGNQFGNINQFHMMNQSRMIAPPPGMNSVPRQNFNSNMGPYNPNFRGPSIQTSDQSLNQPNMMINQHQMKTPSQQIQNMKPVGQSQVNQTQANQSPPQNNPMKNQGTNQNVGPQNVFLNLNLPNKEKDLDLLIHNTYRMFFNNSHSYHNASHHPMLNNRNNLNNQAMNNHPMFNQRHNGTFANSVRQQNGSESPTETDEYAGLMTAREKQWLINIQMLQLNTGTPYIHDFYYTVFLERQASKEKEGVKEAHKANQQNHPFYSGSVKQETNRSRHNSLRHNSSTEEAPRTYVPTQFENSLGKLQCGSVTAPRKIIDVELVSNDTGVSSARPSRAPSVASTTNPAEVPRELKRTKQLLLDIEALYLILLRLEELNDPLAISNALILKEREEKQKLLDAVAKELAALEKQFDDDSNVFLKNIESVQKRHKQDTPKADPLDKRQVVNLAVSQKPAPVKNLLDEDKDELINKMFSGLLHTDRLPQLLTVRKGKALLARFLPRVPPTHYGTRALWSRLLRAPAARRPDPALARLAPHFRTYIQSTNGWSPVLETCTIIAECLDPARTPYALTSVLMISCVCALAERAIILVNTPEATANERQWSKFLKTLARALKNTSLNVARPIQPLSEAKLSAHIKILESRSTIEILQRGRTAAEFADLSKGDLSELLIHHLC